MCRLLIFTLFCSFFFSLSAQETLFYNAKIYNSNGSENQWFVVGKNHIIIDLGKGKPPVKSFEKKIDLGGQYVLPGFVDAQVDLFKAGNSLLRINLKKIATLAELNQLVAKSKPLLRQNMFFGQALDQSVFSEIEPRDWLKKHLPEIPSIIFLKNGEVIFNKKAQNLFELDFFTSKMGVEQKHLANGKIPNAKSFFNQVFNAPRNYSRMQQLAILRAQNELLRNGITTVSDDTYYPYHFKILRNTQYENKLQLRVFPKSHGDITITEKLLPALSLKKLGFIEKDVNFKKMKNTYAKIPASTLERKSSKQLQKLITTHDNPMVFEVKNKKTLAKVLDALEYYPLTQKSHTTHVIDHHTALEESENRRIKDLNVALSLPMYRFLSQKEIDQNAHDYNALFAFQNKPILSSHWPKHQRVLTRNKMASINPFESMHLLTTGTNMSGKKMTEKTNTLTRKQFVQAYTLNPAQRIVSRNFIGKPKVQLGKLEKGFAADFIVLNQNPFKTADGEVANIEVLSTFIDATLVYKKSTPLLSSSEEQTQSINNSDYAVSPAFGYSPTQGFIYGAAYFHWPLDGLNSFYDTVLLANTHGGINLTGNYKNVSKSGNSFGAKITYNTFLENFFGDNANTLEIDRGLLEKKHIEVNTFYELQTKKNLTAKVTLRYQNFTPEKFTINIENDALDDVEAPFDFAQKENSTSLQLELEHNNIDFFNAPKQGSSLSAKLSYIPSGFSNQSTNDHLTSLEISGKGFTPLFSEKLILASRLEMGSTLNGNPSYLQRYRLGGSYRLRGYRSNRFRGKHFFNGSLELRKNIIHQLLDFTAFTDFGSLSEKTSFALEEVKLSYGAGFRVNVLGLSKLRFDFGFQEDGFGVFFQFNEAF